MALSALLGGGFACGSTAHSVTVPAGLFRVNQLGYVLDGPKRAFALSATPLRSRGFEVVDARGRALVRARAGGPARWNARVLVYTLDFSALRRPGLYRIVLAGRRSAPIRVAGAAALYRRPGADAVSFLQSQRDGPNTIRGAMRRVPSHLLDEAAGVFAQPLYRSRTLIGDLRPLGGAIDASGGWFDAGDYLKFVQTASFSDAVLLFTLRSFPAGVANVGALRAEARFGTDWLLKMWDRQSRVLYYQVGIGDGNGRTILGDHDLWRLPQADDRRRPRPGSPVWYETHRPVFAANAPGAPISPNLAGRLAAAFGLCAQVFAASDPAYAHRCLLAGQTIYDQADTNPRGPLLSTSPHAYYDEGEWRDDMALGATELYLATQQVLQPTPAPGPAGMAVELPGSAVGLPRTDLGYYLTRAGRWANAYIEARGSGEDSLNLYDVSTLADYDLVGILESPFAHGLETGEKSVEVPTDAASLLRDRADQLRLALELTRTEPFGLADPSTNLDTVSHALGYAIEARVYDALAGTSRYEAFAQSQLDWVFGANAWGSSFVVGAGTVYPHCLAAQIPNLSGSLDGHGRILRGATVEGPTALSSLTGLSEPEGARRCPTNGRDPFAALSGHGLAYLDDVRSPATSEPTDDLAALTLLAAAQAASDPRAP